MTEIRENEFPLKEVVRRLVMSALINKSRMKQTMFLCWVGMATSSPRVGLRNRSAAPSWHVVQVASMHVEFYCQVNHFVEPASLAEVKLRQNLATTCHFERLRDVER